MILAVFNTQFFTNFFKDDSTIIEIFFDNVDSLNYIEKEKIWLMGFIYLIPINEYITYLPNMINSCVTLIFKIQTQENSSRYYLYKERKSTIMIKGSNADLKRKELKKYMPSSLSTLQLEEHFKDCLKQIPSDVINSQFNKFNENTISYLNKI